MKRYKKEIDGKTVIKTLKEIVIRKDGRVTYNPTEEMVLEDGWVEYVPPTPSEPSAEVLLERAKKRKLLDLYAYDESSEVNDCIIVYQGQELHYWANKTERDSLKGALRDYLSVGRVNYRLDLREIGVSLWIPCESLLGMLAQLEVYAADCYNKTTDHEFAIKACTTRVEVDAYVFRGVGYPEIPRFEL
jgi:hypothetical protein